MLQHIVFKPLIACDTFLHPSRIYPKEYRASIYAGATPTLSSAATALAQVTGMLVGAGPRFMYLWWP
jgi:hypothetical protein